MTHEVGAPEVLGRAVIGVDGAAAHGELIQVGLAEQEGTGVLEPGENGGVVAGREIGEHPGGAGRPLAGGTEVVLEGDGDAVEVADQRGPRLPLVGLARLPPQKLPGHADEGVERLDDAAHPEGGRGQLARPNLTRPYHPTGRPEGLGEHDVHPFPGSERWTSLPTNDTITSTSTGPRADKGRSSGGAPTSSPHDPWRCRPGLGRAFAPQVNSCCRRSADSLAPRRSVDFPDAAEREMSVARDS
jgi:hypothetical protein